ncbi:MAG: leucine-rich repeat domain-containing protein, partial [Clostridiales bacterium]|nr:leucine-rich repeat domain-containing protein [Clostridiales bacterium]
ILVRDGKPDKLGFVTSAEETQSGYAEFEFYFEESEGGNIVGRLYSDNTYAMLDGIQGLYLQYDYVYQSNGMYVLATDGYGFATVSQIVGSQTAVRLSGYYEYDKQYGDYTFVYKNEETNAMGQTYFTLEKRAVEQTDFDGSFRMQGEESGSYLLYDNGELLNYRFDINGYGSAKLYAYDSVSETTELVASGTYFGTDNYDGVLGEWEFAPSSGTGFKFILNVLTVGTDVVPVYVEYNADYARTFTAANGEGTLTLDGYVGARYVTGGATYDGNVTVGENLITFIPYEDDGEGGVTAGGTMYFNVDWTNGTFRVNTTGFVIDGTTLKDYKGASKIIEIPSEVTKIDESACNYVNTDVSLVSVTIPDSVTEIGRLAFQNNYTLRRAVFLSTTPINIDFSSENNPFRWGAGDFVIVVPEGSQAAYKAAWTNCPYDIKGSEEVTRLPEFEITDGVLTRYNKQPNSADVLDVKIPDEVTEIAPSVFRGLDFIRSVDLNNVERIGDGAFESCVNLERVVMNKVKVIADGAFSNCYKLGSNASGVIDLPAIVTVGANAFQSCISLKLVKFGANLAEIGDMAFRECHIYEAEAPLFVELAGSTPPSMGEKVSIGNIAFRIKVHDITVAVACFEAAGWNSYCRHLYIESGEEKGKYMCGAELLDLDGRASFQSTYLMMYAIDGAKITFYEYDSQTGGYTTAEGTIENDVISVNFYGTDYEFKRVNGVVTYTTADGKYTLKCDPLDLLPESYENNSGVATVEFNGKEVQMTVSGYGTKKILDFTDSDGKRYDITLTFDGNTLVVSKAAAEIYIRDITAADGSVINLHYRGSLVYVFGELKINVGTASEPKYLAWSDGGALALFDENNENSFTFTVRYLNTKYTVAVTMNADKTAFSYTYTTE